MNSASARTPARPQGRATVIAAGTLLLAMAGIAGAGSAAALGLPNPVTPPIKVPAPVTSLVPVLGKPITSIPSLPAPPSVPVLPIPAPVSSGGSGVVTSVGGKVTSVGGAVSSTGKKIGGAVSSAGGGIGGAVSSGAGSIGSQLPQPLGGAVSSAGTSVGSTVSGVTGSVGGSVSGGAGSVGGTVGGVGGAVGGGGSAGGNGGSSGSGTGGGATGSGGKTAPGIPIMPTNPTAPQAGAPISGANPLGTSTSAQGAKRGSTSTALSPAGISLAEAWSAGPSTFLTAANLPISAAGPTITAVPAPMLAAAARASASNDGDLLGFVSRNALPGLLVAIATAFVGFVAAGNIKALQPKLAGLSLRLQELDARAKAMALRFGKTASPQAKG